MSSVLLNHLQLSGSVLEPPARRSWITSFDAARPPAWNGWRWTGLPAAPRDVLEVVGKCLARDGFSQGSGVDYRRLRVEGELAGELDTTDGILATIDGLLSSRLRLKFEVRVSVAPGPDDDGTTLTVETGRDLPSWVAAFRQYVEQELSRTPTRSRSEPLVNPMLGPGDPPPRQYVGELRDYSKCAEPDQVRDLEWQPGLDSLVLPLGVYTFDGRPVERPAMLYLQNSHTGAPLAYNGVLIVAPQNSGKTELIVRWAKAANEAGHNLLIVDVKGNLYERLRDEGLRGRIRHFSTDPDPPRPGVERHSLNILHGLSAATANDRQRIKQLAHALLPTERATGQDQDYWVLCTQWLAALIVLGKLVEHYQRPAEILDLSRVYRLASDEALLYTWIDFVRRAEAHYTATGELSVVEPGIEYWITELALLLDPDRVPGGQREKTTTFQHRLAGVKLALEPFSRAGTLYDRIRGTGDFSLDELAGDDPVTIILAAREQDLDVSRTVVSMVVKRLEQILMGRHEVARPARKILLLLDETRRIRAFKAGEYITFARSAKAGCVLVYQSITQIKDLEERTEILENVGAQIYLGSLIGETARRFIGILPDRERTTYSESTSRTEGGPSGDSTSTQRSQDLKPFFGTNELFRLPAGRYPALVYLNDQPYRRFILVDMDRTRIEAAERRRQPAVARPER